MKFVITKKGKSGTVPSITNWLRTVENMELLTEKLLIDHNIKSVWGRHFNQDPLENFFGSIRSHGARNNSPTCAAFEGAFASLLVNNMSSNYSPGSNCEDDYCNIFQSFDELFFSDAEPCTKDRNEIDCDDLFGADMIADYSEKQKNLRIIGLLQYVAGYVLRRSRKVFKSCDCCMVDLFENESNRNRNRYLISREYQQDKIYLTYPNQNFIKLISEIQDVCDYILINKSDLTSITQYIKLIMYTNVNFNFITCNQHRNELIEFLFDFTSRFFCLIWCRNTNKLLNGTSTEVPLHDPVQKLAYKYNCKRRKNKCK